MTWPVSLPKQTPREFRREIKGRETADPRLAGVSLVFPLSKADQAQRIDGWPQYSAWNERPGLGEIFRRNVSLGRPWQPRNEESASPSFRKDLLEAFEGELVIFFHHIVTCQGDKASKIGTAQGTEL